MVGYQWWSIRYGYKKRKRARQEPGRAGIKASATMIGAFGFTHSLSQIVPCTEISPAPHYYHNSQKAASAALTRGLLTYSWG